MVKLPSKTELKNLKNHDAKNFVSIYVPHTKTSNSMTSANRIMLKNLTRKARILLEASEVDEAVMKKILRPAQELHDDYNFWHGLNDDLALFISEKDSFIYQLPAGYTEELVVANSTFDTAPIEAILKDNKHYYLLSLGHKNIQVYKGDNFALQEVTPETLPTDMEDALGIDEYLRSLETHNVAPANPDRTHESYHGQYNAKEEDKKDLLKFFRQIDQRLRAYLQQRKSPPLIMAGVDYLLPIYRKANTYNNLVPKGINRNIDQFDEKDLLYRASSLIKAAN